MQIRAARTDELGALVRLWHEAWHDAHAAIVPAALVRIRTPGNFRERLQAMLPRVRVALVDGAPAGLCVVKGEELDQLFVAAHARGSGVAAALLQDAERSMAVAGIATAWLACAIGNERAARFYGKHGWRHAGTVTISLPVPGGVFELETWRYEKRLGPAGGR